MIAPREVLGSWRVIPLRAYERMAMIKLPIQSDRDYEDERYQPENEMHLTSNEAAYLIDCVQRSMYAAPLNVDTRRLIALLGRIEELG